MKKSVVKLKKTLGNSWGLTMMVCGIGLSVLFGTFLTVLFEIGERTILTHQLTGGAVALIVIIFLSMLVSGLASMLTFAGVIVLIVEKVNGTSPAHSTPQPQDHESNPPASAQTKYSTNPYDPNTSPER